MELSLWGDNPMGQVNTERTPITKAEPLTLDEAVERFRKVWTSIDGRDAMGPDELLDHALSKNASADGQNGVLALSAIKVLAEAAWGELDPKTQAAIRKHYTVFDNGNGTASLYIFEHDSNNRVE